jgi:hypothetical protein
MARDWHGRYRRSHTGSAIVEAVIALPIILLVGLSAVQWAFLHEARAVATHAAFMATRAGSLEHASVTSIRRAFAQALLPLYSPESSAAGLVSTLTQEVLPDVTASARIRILNPTREAFADFGEVVNGELELPYADLDQRSTAPGSASGLNIQDANLLRVQVTYGHPLTVPFVGWIIARAAEATQLMVPVFDARELAMLATERLPITVTSTVRMHSRARLNAAMVSRGALPSVARVVVGNDPTSAPGISGAEPPNGGGGDGGSSPGSGGNSDYELEDYEESPRDFGGFSGGPDRSDGGTGGYDADRGGTVGDAAGNGNNAGSDGAIDLEWDALLLAAAAAAELHCLLTPEEDTPWSAEDLLAYEASATVYSTDGLGFAENDIFYDPTDGFAANLTRVGEGEDAQWILAFRGTEIDDLEDVKTNVVQALLGRSPQYDQAVELATRVQEALGDDVLVGGHSLGGGLATAAAYATGWRAITFNAAGLHSRYREEGTPGDIRAHYIVGDILTTLQGMTPLPDAVGTPITHSATCTRGPVRRHLLAAFEESQARWQHSEGETPAPKAGTAEGVAEDNIDPASGLPMYVPSAERAAGRAAEVLP